MPRPALLLSLCLLLCLVPTAHAAADDVLPEGEPIILGEPIEALRLNNYAGNAGRATLSRVDVTGQPFNRAAQVDSRERTLFWHAAYTTGELAPMRRGDVMLLTVWARTVSTQQEDGLGTLTAYVQQSSRPFNPSLMETVTFGSEWTRIDLPFVVQQNYPADNDELTLGLGGAQQVVQLGGVSLRRMPPGTAMQDLPVYRITYDGRDADAPWRAAAVERIAEHRTSPLRVRVVDAAGEPVRGADVHVQMIRSAFGWGTTVNANLVTGDGPDAQRYRRELAERFNLASTENALKWGRWSSPGGRERAMATLRWLDDHDLRAHGHVLVWPSWAKSRVDLTAERAAAEAGDVQPLRQRIDAHIADIAGATAGLVDAWDVMNEPFNNNDFMDLMGRSEMARWFELAREHAPDAKLLINDFGILTVGEQETSDQQDHYFETVGELLDAGAPVEAIGMQGHFGSGGLTPPDRLVRIFDRFAQHGLPIHVTEYDLMTQDEQLQGDYTRDLLTAAYSHPAVAGVTLWGFWDGSHWRGNAPMFRRDWSLKPAGEAWRDLVLGQWRTVERATTDDAGVAEVVAHHGEYVVSVTLGDHEAQQTHVRVGPGGSTVELVLER
jgi:GH35 family endo-1,4-beta-xylanase